MSKQKKPPPHEASLGERLRYWRLRSQVTQAEIERRAGLAHNALSRIENGQVDPQFETVMRIAEALGMSFEELQQRTIPPSHARDSGEGVENLVDGLKNLPPAKRQQVIQAFLQILKQLDQ